MNGAGRLLTRMFDSRCGEWSAAPETWLSTAEREEYARWRDAGRRREWLGGRWLVKGMIQSALAESSPERAPAGCDEIEVLSRDAAGRGRPPRALVAGRLLPWHVSLAHHGGVVCAVVSTAPGLRVGIDVVSTEALNRRACVCGPWFTVRERRWLQHSPDRQLAGTLWAVKEAVFKATNRGDPFLPERIEVGRRAVDRYTWTRDDLPQGADDSLIVSRRAGFIVAVALVRPGVTREGHTG